MKLMRIEHRTAYRYREAVSFGEHRAMIRPREGHDLHVVRARIETEPASDVRWVRDIYGNSVAVMAFASGGDALVVTSDVLVELHDVEPFECPVKEFARHLPFQYRADEQVEIIPYRVPSYAHDAPAVLGWLEAFHHPGDRRETLGLLDVVNAAIFDGFRYARREEAGVQLPCETLAKGSGSCRDFAVFMMEAARHLGLAARFVTGYIQMGEGQHGATHAWTEVYIPGAGWIGFDPTNRKRAGAEHVAVGVARDQLRAAPLAGTWSGKADAFEGLEVVVKVVEVA